MSYIFGLNASISSNTI